MNWVEKANDKLKIMTREETMVGDTVPKEGIKADRCNKDVVD